MENTNGADSLRLQNIETMLERRLPTRAARNMLQLWAYLFIIQIILMVIGFFVICSTMGGASIAGAQSLVILPHPSACGEKPIPPAVRDSGIDAAKKDLAEAQGNIELYKGAANSPRESEQQNRGRFVYNSARADADNKFIKAMGLCPVTK